MQATHPVQATMKARRTLRRTRSRGFTLMELMVVVILIALLAGLAVPSMVRSRNDRLTFDYARQTSEMIHAARSRATGRGAAHLFVFSQSFGGSRGSVLLFEALDGVATTLGGPNPLPSCRSADFTWAANYTVGAAPDTTGGHSGIIDALNINGGSGSVQETEDITMTGFSVADDGTQTPAPVIAMCITPNGTTYTAAASSMPAAIAALATTSPFTGVIEIDVARHNTGTVVGLKRRVLVGSGAQPRIKSE